MTAPDPESDTPPSTEESDLTTTAEVLTAREILKELGEETTMIHRVEPLPRLPGWWQRLLAWVGLK